VTFRPHADDLRRCDAHTGKEAHADEMTTPVRGHAPAWAHAIPRSTPDLRHLGLDPGRRQPETHSGAREQSWGPLPDVGR
jgi:hypothetical protein